VALSLVPVIQLATSCTKRTVSRRPASSPVSSSWFSLSQRELYCISGAHRGKYACAHDAACFFDACLPCVCVYSALHRVSTA
jgi:hypothetical protein